MKYKKIEDLKISTYVETKRKDNIVKIKINNTIANMQTDYADFEALSIMYKTIEKDIEVEIEFEIPGYKKLSNIKKWNGKFGNDNADINSYLRFLFRLMIFEQAFKNWVKISEKNKEELERFKKIYNQELKEGRVTNNYPKTESNYNYDKGEEHRIEKKLTHTTTGKKYLQELYKKVYPNEELICMYDQLPNGLFNTEIDKEPHQSNRIFTSGAYDIWGIDSKKNFCVFELKKDKGNSKLGVISELFFYVVFAKQILCNEKCLNSKGRQETYRGYDKLYEYTTSNKSKNIRGIFLLGSGVHPAILENRDELIKLLNTNSFGIEFNFIQYNKEKIDKISEKDIDIKK